MTATQTTAQERGAAPAADYVGASATQCFLIVGVARSGTSFLQRILNRHPDVRLSYEGHLMTEGWECYKRGQPFQDEKSFQRLLDEFIDCDADQPRNHWLAENIREHRQTLWNRHRAEPGFSKLIEHIYQLGGPVRCWGNKILRSEHSPVILDNFPEARFAVLIRDPRSVYASQKRYFTGMRLSYSAMYSNQHYRWARDIASRDPRFYLIQYEKFVQEPREMLTDLFASMSVPTEGIVDEILRHDPPHDGSLDKWRSQLSPEEIERIESLCFDRMQQMGYEPTVATAQKELSAVGRGAAMISEFFRILPWRPSHWRRKRLWERFVTSLRD